MNSADLRLVSQAIEEGDARNVRHCLLKSLDDLHGSQSDPSLKQMYWRMGNSWAKRDLDGRIDPAALNVYRELDSAGFRVETPKQATNVPELREAIQGVVDRLPPFDYTPKESGEPDFYGATDCIAHSLGMARPYPSEVTWTHGWFKRDKFIESSFNCQRKKHVNNLVYTKWVRDEMAHLGYQKLHPVGAPILYAGQTQVPRISDSVLYIPQHSTESIAFDNKNQSFDVYAAVLDEFRNKKLLAVCLGAKDVLIGNYVKTFEDRKIPWITGAWIFDRNALVRMQRIFRSFEYMVTDTQGSHIPYAAYCGCKVILRETSTKMVSRKILYDNTESWIMKDRMKIRKSGLEYLKEIAPFLFGTLESAETQIKWGEIELGYENKLDPEKIGELLGWDLNRRRSNIVDRIDYQCFTQSELMLLAKQKEQEGMLKASNSVLDVLIRRNPKRGHAHFLKARVCLQSKAYENALFHINEALNCNFNTREVLKLKASIDRALLGDGTQSFLLSPNTMDIYLAEQRIISALTENLPLFSGVFLDVGCGFKPYKRMLTGEGSRIEHYIGLDIETETHQGDLDLRWDGRTIPLDDDSVDSAMATEVLEHCPEPEVLLSEVLRVLKPGGLFFFTTPFLWPLHEGPQDEYRYTPWSLERHLKNCGFTDIKIKPTGGWDASLAQMLGLWVRRRPMSKCRRRWLSLLLFPLYRILVAKDRPVAKFSHGCYMMPGIAGTARAAR